ncbi:MAG: RDD family protein [Bacilli bacterium]|nr:RDD family protein [Bacilli bacterium]
MNIASYMKRTWAYVIDFVFALIISAGVLVAAIFLFRDFVTIPAFFVVLMFIAADWLIYTLMYSIWLKTSNGRTLGNLIIGLRVVHNDVSKLTFGDCISRSAMNGLIVLAIINTLYVMISHTEKSIFDRVTKTLVADWRNRSI